MKSKTMMLGAICALGFMASMSISCSDIRIYEIDAPDYLQAKIDSIAAAKAQKSAGDTTVIDITKFEVGSNDGSTAFWGDWSQSFKCPSGKLLHFEFDNYGTKANNWSNWNLVCANVGDDAHSTDDNANYAEYFVLRSDAYGWGGTADGGLYDSSQLKADYPDETNPTSVADWDQFKEVMYGAHCVIEVDHSNQGTIFVTAVSTSADGNHVLTETYNHPCSTDDYFFFITTDNSWFIFKEDCPAYTIPSKVTEIPDYKPVSITVTGQPSMIEVGQEDVWGDAVATVTFEDESSTIVDDEDITLTVPDITTVGTKTIIYTYNKTKKGEYCDAVGGYYTIEVVNPVKSLSIKKAPAFVDYRIFDQDVLFCTDSLVVEATYADETTGTMDLKALTFGKVTGGQSGTRDVEISYAGSESVVTATCPVNVTRGTAEVGQSDFKNGWWTAFSEEKNVASGESVVFKMMLYSDNLESWHSPCVIIRNAAQVEYAVVRMDNYGWGASYADTVKTSDWNMDIFTTSQNLSDVIITVKNNGDNTADIRYDVTYANGEKHYQLYTGLAIDSSDLQTLLVTEESYLVMYE